MRREKKHCDGRARRRLKVPDKPPGGFWPWTQWKAVIDLRCSHSSASISYTRPIFAQHPSHRFSIHCPPDGFSVHKSYKSNVNVHIKVPSSFWWLFNFNLFSRFRFAPPKHQCVIVIFADFDVFVVVGVELFQHVLATLRSRHIEKA